MLRHLALATSLLVLPSIAFSQRGGRTQSDRRTELFDKNDNTPKGPTLKVRDLEEASTIKLLIDKKKDLKLTDAQVASLKDAEKKLKEKNDPLYQRVDTLLRDMRSGASGSSETDRTKVAIARSGLMSTIQELDANNDAAAKEAVATFDPEAQTKANEMLAKLREDEQKTVRQKLSTGGGGMRGGEPPQR